MENKIKLLEKLKKESKSDKEFLNQNIIREKNEFDVENYKEEIFNACPPEKAYLVDLKFRDIIELNSNYPNKQIRRVFDRKEKDYLEYEKNQIKDFQAYIRDLIKKDKINKILLERLEESLQFDSMILRLLQATSFNFVKTQEYLETQIEWRNSDFFPLEITNRINEILSSGFLYCFGRDCNYRPIFILDPKVYIKHEKIHL